jgi:hypothetical protein
MSIAQVYDQGQTFSPDVLDIEEKQLWLLSTLPSRPLRPSHWQLIILRFRPSCTPLSMVTRKF